MKFKFQKLVDKRIDLKYDWMLVLETSEDVIRYHENVDPGKIRQAWDNIDEVKEGKAHLNSNLAIYLDLSHREGESLLMTTARVMDNIILAKIKYVVNTGKVYQNKAGGYMPNHPDYEVIDEMILDGDSIVFPDYTYDDIRTKQWAGGTHWYAYVGEIWVEESRGGADHAKFKGQRKFDTQAQAQEAAEYFVRMINKKTFEFKEQ